MGTSSLLIRRHIVQLAEIFGELNMSLIGQSCVSEDHDSVLQVSAPSQCD